MHRTRLLIRLERVFRVRKWTLNVALCENASINSAGILTPGKCVCRERERGRCLKQTLCMFNQEQHLNTLNSWIYTHTFFHSVYIFLQLTVTKKEKKGFSRFFTSSEVLSLIRRPHVVRFYPEPLNLYTFSPDRDKPRTLYSARALRVLINT